ncbi:hypothetical protein GC194_02910 [bacterium]|nr:hypothetical protein [bacterium]
MKKILAALMVTVVLTGAGIGATSALDNKEGINTETTVKTDKDKKGKKKKGEGCCEGQEKAKCEGKGEGEGGGCCHKKNS